MYYSLGVPPALFTAEGGSMTNLGFIPSFREDRFQCDKSHFPFLSRSVQCLQYQFLTSWEHFTRTLTEVDHPKEPPYFLQPVHSSKILKNCQTNLFCTCFAC